MSVSASSRPRASVTSLRGVGALAAVLVLVGTAVTAPFSLQVASADDAVAAMIERHGDQQFTTAVAPDQVFDLPVSAVEEDPGSGDDANEKDGTRADAKKGDEPVDAEYTLEEFMFTGSVNWGGHKFTFYSQQVLPGSGLQIPGRHVNEGGYVSDEDGYIVLAGDAPKGTVYETPFGYEGKIYDRGTVGNHLDVYIR